MKEKMADGEYVKLQELTRDLQSARRLIDRLDNPNSEVGELLRQRALEIQLERDKQFMKLLRMRHRSAQRKRSFLTRLWAARGESAEFRGLEPFGQDESGMSHERKLPAAE